MSCSGKGSGRSRFENEQKDVFFLHKNERERAIMSNGAMLTWKSNNNNFLSDSNGDFNINWPPVGWQLNLPACKNHQKQ